MKKLLLTLSALSMLVAFDVSSAEYEEKLENYRDNTNNQEIKEVLNRVLSVDRSEREDVLEQIKKERKDQQGYIPKPNNSSSRSHMESLDIYNTSGDWNFVDMYSNMGIPTMISTDFDDVYTDFFWYDGMSYCEVVDPGYHVHCEIYEDHLYDLTDGFSHSSWGIFHSDLGVAFNFTTGDGDCLFGWNNFCDTIVPEPYTLYNNYGEILDCSDNDVFYAFNDDYLMDCVWGDMCISGCVDCLSGDEDNDGICDDWDDCMDGSGDTDNNGTVNIVDINNVIIGYLNASEVCTDHNNDGTTNVLDLITILNIILSSPDPSPTETYCIAALGADPCNFPLNTIAVQPEGHVLYNFSEEVFGFQFQINDADISGAEGGDWGVSGMTAATDNSVVVGISFDGSTLNPACGMLTVLEVDQTPSSISNIIFTDGNNDIIDVGVNCGCDGIVDECGVCDGNGIPDGACDCDGNVLDECDVCGGGGILAGECDCDGNVDLGCGCGEAGPSGCDNECGSTAVEDACGVCGGDGEDADNDGECDDTDDCVGELDDCGVCNGNSDINDCNGDGIDDVCEEAFDIGFGEGAASGDISGDGTLNITDIVQYVSIILSE